MMKNGFTAFIDSGIGGISTLAEAVRMLPEENFLFYADAARAPYGDRSTEEIRSIIEMHAADFMEAGAKAILIACNTATSAAAAHLRETLPIPILGVEPALKPAALNESGQIIVMATQLTIREEKFQNLLAQYSDEHDIVPLACPGLMELIEKDPMGEETREYMEQILSPYRNSMKALVLGCTHYVFLRPLLSQMFPGVTLYDGNEGVCRHLKKILEEKDLCGGEGIIEWDCSLEGNEREAYLRNCRDTFDRLKRIQ